MSRQIGNRKLANLILIFCAICLSCSMYNVFVLHCKDTSNSNEGFSAYGFKQFQFKENAAITTTTAESLSRESSDKTHSQGDEMPFRKWAYAFLAGGCSRENRQHSGFIANIAIAAKILHEHNSTADVVALIQMSYDSKHDTLSDDETKFLEAMPNVKIKYLPRFGSRVYENFYALMMEKFQILGLVDYSRVLFLDSDVQPLASLDYIFDLSEPLPENGPAVIEENFIIRWSAEPSAGGFFMLKPSAENYKRSQEIIIETEKKALDLPWPHWDEVEGFGHKIAPSDKWMGTKSRIEGTNWTWHGAFADQGFLYHWVRYEKGNVSIAYKQQIDNYSIVDGKVRIKTLPNEDSEGILNKPSSMYGITPWNKHYMTKSSPWCDFVHYIGTGKPWNLDRKTNPKVQEPKYVKWFAALDELEKMTNVKMEFVKRKTPYGAFPVSKERIDYIKLKAKNNWDVFKKV